MASRTGAENHGPLQTPKLSSPLVDIQAQKLKGANWAVVTTGIWRSYIIWDFVDRPLVIPRSSDIKFFGGSLWYYLTARLLFLGKSALKFNTKCWQMTGGPWSRWWSGYWSGVWVRGFGPGFFIHYFLSENRSNYECQSWLKTVLRSMSFKWSPFVNHSTCL